MKKLKSFRNILSYIPKKFFVVLGLLGIGAAVAVPVLTGAYGPERETFTIEKPASYVTFNSITNNPNIGDERNFVAARVDDGASKGKDNVWNGNEITVEDGKSYWVRLYVHNNAAANLNLVATNVRAMAAVQTGTAKSLTIEGFITADNAKPKQIWDYVTFNSSEDFYLTVDSDYGVHYANNKSGADDYKLNYNNFFTSTGSLLGYEKLDGNIPGCFQYDGYVSFKVRPIFPTADSDFSTSKQVKPHGSTDPTAWKSAAEQGVTWSEDYAAQPGELVNFRIDYVNVTGEKQDNVTLRDILPAGLAVESVRFWNTLTGAWQTPTNNITTTGINIGNVIGKNTTTRAELVVRMPAIESLACGTNTFNNIGRVSINSGTPKEDGASVTVEKDCPPPEKCEIPGKEDLDKDDPNCKEDDPKCEIPGKEDLNKDDPNCKEDVTPEYTCKLLNVDSDKIVIGDKAKFTVNVANSEGVNVKEIRMDFGDNNTMRQTNNVFEHTYAIAGDYIAKAYVTFEVDGQVVTDITSMDCAKTINIVEQPPVEKCPIKGKEHLDINDPGCKDTTVVVPPTTTTPSELPKTGGELGVAIGISSVVTAAAYYIASRRKLNC